MSRMRKKTKQQPLWQRMRQAYDRVTGQGLRGELQGCRQLTLQGCERILEYGEHRIRLLLRDPDVCDITVLGKQLVCLSYHADAIVVQGLIRQIVLSDGNETSEQEQTEDV
jgi:hypothetical protein